MTWPSLQAAPAEGAHPLKRALKEMCFQVAERPAAWHRLRQRQREMRRVIAAVDRFIAPTRFLGARLIEWGIPAEKIVYHDYGTMELPYAPRAPRRPGQRLRFGYLGGATYEKGLHVLFEAFRGFAEADLVVYGESQPWLQRQHGDILAQPNVRLAGPINDEQKAALLPQLDALVVPSIWYENSPLVIHEAFQAGVPVICSDIGGMAELVTDGVDGLHFRVEDAPDLRRVLRQCVHDPDRLERLRAGIRKPTSMREHVLREILPLYEALSADRLSTAWFVQASRMPSRLPAGSPAEPPSPGTTSAFATGPWAWQLWLGTALSPGVVQRLQSLKRQWGPPIKFFLISE
jgi:glycosyltransferase involved in cell wall biosynthesis